MYVYCICTADRKRKYNSESDLHSYEATKAVAKKAQEKF